jgi:FAD/FMN-containing dehydrogenase
MIIKAVEDSYACGYPRDAAAVLIIEVEGPTAGLKEQAMRIREICMQTNCRDIQEAKNNDERNRLWQGRRGAFGAVARLAPNYLVNDATVPRTKLPEALAKVAEITKNYNCDHGNVFHAGDGNLHPLLLFDSRDTDQLHRVENTASVLRNRKPCAWFFPKMILRLSAPSSVHLIPIMSLTPEK